MVSKQKLLYKIFILLTATLLLLLFLIFSDSRNTSISNGEMVLNNYSATNTCSNISKYIFNTDLLKKNETIEDFLIRFLNYDYSGFFKNIRRKISGLYSGMGELVNYKRLRNFRQNYIALTGCDSDPSFGITPMHSIFKLQKDCGNLPQPVIQISDHCCKGEWESVQLIIVPFNDMLKQLEIKVNGLPFPAKYMQCFWGDNAWCNESDYPADSGWVADPLIPMEMDSSSASIRFTCFTGPSVIPFGETRSIWLNYFVPCSVKAGVHTFTITVSALSANTRTEQNTGIKLNVFDYQLPMTMHMKTAFSLDEYALKNYYNINEIPITLQKEYYRFLLDYHLNPVSLYTSIDNTIPAPEDWQWCKDRGANYFNIAFLDNISPDSVNAISKWKEAISKKINYLKQHALLDNAYIFGFDEVVDGNYTGLKYVAGLLRSINKDIPFVCTTVPVKELSGYVNTWVPNLASFTNEMKTFSATEKLWTYVCCNYKKSVPNFFIEYPAIDPRIIFWQCSKNNMEGFLYYCINNWQFNDDTKGLRIADNAFLDQIIKGKRWPDIPWTGHSYRHHEGQRYFNGDGQLIYPGRNMKLYPSVRLINIREGIEDYEYLYQLKQMQKRWGNSEKSSVIGKFLTTVYGWFPSYRYGENDPEELLRYRNLAGALLESCGK